MFLNSFSLDESWVLTAAHCTLGSKRINVYGGLHDTRSKKNGTMREVLPHNMYVHPNYLYPSKLGQSDVTLLYVTPPFSINRKWIRQIVCAVYEKRFWLKVSPVPLRKYHTYWISSWESPCWYFCHSHWMGIKRRQKINKYVTYFIRV